MVEPLASNAFYPDGTPIVESDLPKAIADGTVRWRKGATISMKDVAGQRHDVPAEQATTAIKRGFIPETRAEQEYNDFRAKQGLREEIGTAAGSLLSTATLGGFDALLRAASPEMAREEAMARRASPTATTVGEIGGYLLPIGGELAATRFGLGAAGKTALSVAQPLYGVSRAATAAGEVGAGILERAGVGEFGQAVARQGIAGGTEGFAFGASRELSRQALGDEDLSVSKILAAGGEGAMFGAGGGALFGAAGYGLGRGFRAAAGGVGKSELTTPEYHAARAVGLTPADAASIGVDRIKIFAREALDRGVIPEGRLAGLLENLGSKSAKVEAIRKELGAEIGSVYKRLDDAKMPLDFHQIDDNWSKQLGELTAKGGEYGDLAQRMERKWGEPIRRAKGYEDIWKVDSDLRKYAESLNIDKLEGREISKLRSNLKTGILEEIARRAPDEATRLMHLDRLYGAFADVSDAVLKRAAREELAGAGVRPYEIAAGAAGAAVRSPVGQVFGAASAASRWALGSPRVAAVLARSLDDLRATVAKQSRTISNAAKSAASDAVKTDFSLPAKGVLLAKEYAERAHAVQESAANPDRFQAAVAQRLAPLSDIDPVLGRRAAVKQAEDYAWLRSRLPTMSINATVDPNKSGARGTKKGAKLAVPASTAASYVRASKALADPVSAAAKVGTGKMTPETIDVLRDRRPELRAELQQRFDEQQARLDSKGKALQYSTRVEASLATGKAYDKTMSPSFISMVQAHWTNKRAQSAVAVPMAGAGGGGRGSLRRSSHEQRSRLTRFHSDTEALGYGDL